MRLNSSSFYTIMDPFEETVQALLASKRQEAKQLLKNPEASVPENPTDERLPYNISKHVQYIQQEAYFRKRKALKKQTDIV